VSGLAHWQAVRGLLDPLAALEITVYEGSVPTEPTYPYVVLRMSSGADDDVSLARRGERTTWWVRITSVALSDPAVRWVADQVKPLLKNVTPAVAGRTCGPIRHEAGQDVVPDTAVRDDTTALHPMYTVDTYRFASYPG
jgi:hypothetical protein